MYINNTFTAQNVNTVKLSIGWVLFTFRRKCQQMSSLDFPWCPLHVVHQHQHRCQCSYHNCLVTSHSLYSLLVVLLFHEVVEAAVWYWKCRILFWLSWYFDFIELTIHFFSPFYNPMVNITSLNLSCLFNFGFSLDYVQRTLVKCHLQWFHS